MGVVCVGFVMFGCVYVWVCVCMGFVMCGCVGFVMCGCFDNCVGVLVISVFVLFLLCIFILICY